MWPKLDGSGRFIIVKDSFTKPLSLSFMAKRQDLKTTYHPKTLALGIDTPYNPVKSIDAYFEEFLNLIKTDQIQVDEKLFIKLRTIDSSYFLTKGKLEQIKEFCDQNKIEQVIISEPLTAQQERNIEDVLQCVVIDRTGLILQIFEKAAQSAEGKAQVAIAMLQHQKTRLAGRGISMSQQAGRIGSRGPGETAKEEHIRHINNTIHRFKRQLETMDQARETQRKQRIAAKVPLICLIGYTNAGKSTILNALTKSSVLAEDKLFATLDTTTRELYVDGKKKGLLSDTVGFIQLLPPHLIEAFKSTLSELQYANLLLQVVDVSDPSFQDHIRTVHEILNDLEIEKPMLYVFNKIDKVANIDELMPLLEQYQPHVMVSARSKENLKPLIDFLASWHPSE